MKKLALSLLMFVGVCISLSSLTGCDKTKHWEYRAYIVNGIDEGDFRSKTVFPDLEELNKLGEEGWELVSTYEKLETAHPNYGNEKYVTGLQANTRTGAVVFLFKRFRSGSKSDKDTLESYNVYAFDPVAATNKRVGEAFLEEKAAQQGYTKTESGLVYKVLKEGSGSNFKDGDVVLVNYRGTHINGEEFDSNGDKPIPFDLSQVIPGFAEMVKLMKPGQKVEAIIPSDLAYGIEGSRSIKPNETLVFEMETVGIKPKETTDKTETKK